MCEATHHSSSHTTHAHHITYHTSNPHEYEHEPQMSHHHHSSLATPFGSARFTQVESVALGVQQPKARALYCPLNRWDTSAGGGRASGWASASSQNRPNRPMGSRLAVSWPSGVQGQPAMPLLRCSARNGPPAWAGRPPARMTCEARRRLPRASP